MSAGVKKSVTHVNALTSSVSHTGGTWRARPIRYGGYAVKAELPCMKGLAAWFSIATVAAADDDELQLTERAKAVARDDADFTVRTCNSHNALLFAL